MTSKTAEIDERSREEKPSPLTANEGDGRKRSGGNSGKALQKKVVRESRDGGSGGDGGVGRSGGGIISVLEAGFGGDRDGSGGGIVRVREARFDEPREMARIGVGTIGRHWRRRSKAFLRSNFYFSFYVCG